MGAGRAFGVGGPFGVSGWRDVPRLRSWMRVPSERLGDDEVGSEDWRDSDES